MAEKKVVNVVKQAETYRWVHGEKPVHNIRIHESGKRCSDCRGVMYVSDAGFSSLDFCVECDTIGA